MYETGVAVTRVFPDNEGAVPRETVRGDTVKSCYGTEPNAATRPGSCETATNQANRAKDLNHRSVILFHAI